MPSVNIGLEPSTLYRAHDAFQCWLKCRSPYIFGTVKGPNDFINSQYFMNLRIKLLTRGNNGHISDFFFFLISVWPGNAIACEICHSSSTRTNFSAENFVLIFCVYSLPGPVPRALLNSGQRGWLVCFLLFLVHHKVCL